MPVLKNVGSGNSNIRNSNSTSASIIGKLAPGHSLTLLTNAGANNGYDWFVVDYNGQTGYVANAGGLQILWHESVLVKNRLHWNYYGMNPVQYVWHSDMRFHISSRLPWTPYFANNFAKVGFDMFFCYGPWEGGHVYTPYPYAISFHGMTNGFYWNVGDIGSGGELSKYFDMRSICESKWNEYIYEHSGAIMKTPTGDAALPGVPQNVNMTYGHLYTALKMGVCVYIRAWARTHSSGTSGGADGYIYSGYWDGDNNIPGTSHTFDNGLGICHPRCVVVQNSIGSRSENICKAQLRVHGAARVWNGKDCYSYSTKTVGGNNTYKVSIQAAIQDEIQGLTGNTPNANAGGDIPRGAKEVFKQDVYCASEATNIDFSFNPAALFGDDKRGKRIALRVWYKFPDAYDNWNTYGPDYEAYRCNNMIDGHIPFPSTVFNRKPNFWYETSCELRKDNAAIATDLLAKGNDPEGDEYATWSNMTFDTNGSPMWAPWVEIRHKQNANHQNLYVDFYNWANQIVQKSNGGLTLANLLNKALCTELFAFDGFSGSGVWQNCPTVNKWQSHSPRFDMRPRNARVTADKPAGDIFTFTVNYDYPIAGCRHMLIMCPENENGQATGATDGLERYILGTSWRDWGFNLTDWSTNKSITVDLSKYYGDNLRGRNVQLICGVISPWGWESTTFWNQAGVTKVRFNEYPETDITGVRTNANLFPSDSKYLTPSAVTLTARDMYCGYFPEDAYANTKIAVSGYIKCNATADGTKTTAMGIAYTMTNGETNWVTGVRCQTGDILNNKGYYSATFTVPSNYASGLKIWLQIDVPYGTPGYSITFEEMRYKAFTSEPGAYFNTGDIIDVSSHATDRDGISKYKIGVYFDDTRKKEYVFNSNKNVSVNKIDLKQCLTDLGVDYKSYAGRQCKVVAAASDGLGLGKNPLSLVSSQGHAAQRTVNFDYKPTINYTLSTVIGTTTVVNLAPANYTAPRKYKIEYKKASESTWRTVYASSSNETRNITYTLDPSAHYGNGDRGQVFHIRCSIISTTGAFISDYSTKEFTWGAPPNITLTSIGADYSIKDGVTRNGRFGTIATFNYTVSSSGPASITIQATINGVTKNILTKDVASGNTTHSDRIDLKNSFSNAFCDYDATFAIKGVAYGLTTVVTNTNDYNAKGKIVFLEPFNKGSITVTNSSNSIKVSNKVHGKDFVLNSSSPNSPYAKTRGVNMNKFHLYRGVSGNEQATKTLIATVEFNGNSVQALNNARTFLAEQCSMLTSTDYKFQIAIEVYYFQEKNNPAYVTVGNWSSDMFRFTPAPNPAVVVAPINCNSVNTSIPCRRPPFIFTVPAQSEEGNKEIDVVEVHWNGAWVRSDKYSSRFDNLASNNVGRTIKFYPPTDSINNNVDHNAKIAIRSKVTKSWSVINVPLIMIDPQSVRKGVGSLIEIYSEPREFINRLRRAYGLSNYNYPSLTARDTKITRDNLINCLAIAQNEVATKVNSYTGTKKLPAISYQNMEYINSSQTDEVYNKLATFGTI